MTLLFLLAKYPTEKPALAQTAVCLSRPIQMNKDLSFSAARAGSSRGQPKREKREVDLETEATFLHTSLALLYPHFPYNILFCTKDIYLIAVTELWEKAF